MATTTRLTLFKPAGTDLIDRVVDFNNNWDLLDTKMPAYMCTSSTRPTGSTLYNGLMIYETDTGSVYVYESSATAWRPVAVYRSGGTSNFYSASVSRFLDIACGSSTGTTIGTGELDLAALIIAATGWSAVNRFVAYNGDEVTRPNVVIGNTTVITTPVTFATIRLKTGNTGAAVASSSCRIDWIAMGK